jgi:hypothetical protein
MMARINFLPLLVYGPLKIMGKMISFSLSFILLYSHLFLSLLPLLPDTFHLFILSLFFFPFLSTSSPRYNNFLIPLFRPLPLPYLYLVYPFPIPLICSPCRYCCQWEKLFYVCTIHQQRRVGCFPKLDNDRLLFISRCLAVLLLKKQDQIFIWPLVFWDGSQICSNMCRPNITHILACTSYSGLVFVSVCECADTNTFPVFSES